MNPYQQLKQFISERYDYITAIDIAKINREYSFGCTLRECVNLYSELFKDN